MTLPDSDNPPVWIVGGETFPAPRQQARHLGPVDADEIIARKRPPDYHSSAGYVFDPSRRLDFTEPRDRSYSAGFVGHRAPPKEPRERVVLKREPIRATLSRPACPQPDRRVVQVGSSSEWWSLRCKKWTCPGCRIWKTAELVDLIDGAFEGRPAYLATFDRADWHAAYLRIYRGGVDYVNLPAPAESVAVMTYEPLPESGPAGDAREMAETAVKARPLSKGIRWNPGGSAEWKAAFSTPKAPPLAPDEKPVLLGTWDHRVSMETLGEKAKAVGLDPVVLEGDGAERVAGLRFDVEWDDERYVQLRRWVGFTWPDHTAADPPPDVLDGESWDAVAMYLASS